jgi:hypothetical protein
VSHPLLARLRGADPGERAAACRDASGDPAAVILADALVEALGDPLRAVAQAASDALAEIGRAHALVPALRAALHAGSPQRRLWAALTLARLEPPDLRLLPALVGGLGLADGKLRWAALRLLVETGRLFGEVLALLVGLSRGDPSPVVRRMARHGLRELGRDSPAAQRALAEGTRDPDVAARRAAYAALASALAPPGEVVALLAAALGSEADGACRRIASVALGEIGARDPAQLDAAARAALCLARDASPDPDLRRGAQRALARAGL